MLKLMKYLCCMHMTFEPYVYTTSSGLPEKMKIIFQLLELTKNENSTCHGLFQGLVQCFNDTVYKALNLCSTAVLVS